MSCRVMLVAAAVAAALVAAPAAIPAKTPAVYDNCTNFNKKYPHGVGVPGAKDKREGKNKDDPVTHFKRSASIYKSAMKWNDDLDRDKDRVACEKD